MTNLGIGLIGYAFMGAAHSQAWRNAPRFFDLPPLRGHLDPRLSLPAVRGPTGTVLSNLFAGTPAELAHPRYIEACLALGTACTGEVDDFTPYRQTMLGLIK